MKHFVFVLFSILAAIVLSVGRSINFIPTNSSVSFFDHPTLSDSGFGAVAQGPANVDDTVSWEPSPVAAGSPKMDGTVVWKPSSSSATLCNEPGWLYRDQGTMTIKEVDCHKIIDRYKTTYGFWEVKKYKNCDTDCGDIAVHGTCSMCIARRDGKDDAAYVGNYDAVRFMDKVLNVSQSPLYVARTRGFSVCPGAGTVDAAICFKVYPTGGSKEDMTDVDIVFE
ncbi:hypothetical protein PG987_013407 [Apiospora arundinis]